MAGSFGWLRRLFTSLSQEDRKLAAAIANITGRTPVNLDLYKLAVRHSSFNSGANGEHNERLEFLGDAVLGIVVAEYLFKKFPKRNEGFMTEIRSRLVNGEALGQLAGKIGLDKLIQYEGRRKQPHTHRSMNGDAMEALIGAFYLDTDFNTTRAFILDRLIKPNVDLNEVVESDHNHKSRMIEWAQKHSRRLSFEIAADSGRGNKDFVANVILDGKQFATGSGFSKKKAEQAAALSAIKKIKDKAEKGTQFDDEPSDRRREGGREPREGRERDGRDNRRRDQQHLSENRSERGPRPPRAEREESATPTEPRQLRPERQSRAELGEEFERIDQPEPTPRPDRAERPERTDRPERTPRAERERGDRPERPERNDRQKPPRVNQEELYNEAAPLAPAEEAGITATEPRPERQPRQRPPRRERPPRRNKDSEVIGEATEPSEGIDAVSGPEPERGASNDTPVSDKEFKNIFNFAKDKEEVTPAPTAEPTPESKPQPATEPAPVFQVNVQRIQPKAVEIKPAQLPSVSAPQTTPGKRKWVNVSKGEEAASPAASADASGPAAADMARQAFNSISDEADAFINQLPAEEPTPSAEKPEEDSATQA